MKVFLMLLGFLRKQIGLRTDAASATGSLHAKTTDIKNDVAAARVMLFVPSDNVRITSALEHSTTSTTEVKVKEVFVGSSGKVRVSFDHKYVGGYGTFSLKINGVSVLGGGYNHTVYGTLTADVTVNANDLISLFIYSNTSTVTAYASNFKISCDFTNFFVVNQD